MVAGTEHMMNPPPRSAQPIDLHGAVYDILEQIGQIHATCATLLERTNHLATREDVTAAIQLHKSSCSSTRIRAPRSTTSGAAWAQLAKGVGLALATAATAVLAWLGFSSQ